MIEKQNGFMMYNICDCYGNIDHNYVEQIEKLQNDGWHVIAVHRDGNDSKNKHISLVHYGPHPEGENDD